MRAEACLVFCAAISIPFPTRPTADLPRLDPYRLAGRVVFLPGQEFFVQAPNGGKRRVLSLLVRSKRLRYGDYVWNEGRLPDGPYWLWADLGRQTLSVFRGANEIGVSVILYGADGKPTPRGYFPILARYKDHRSSLYDAPMPYTLRLTDDGVAIHGSNVRERAATHGCIGVPTGFAERVFAVVRAGDPVLIQ